MSVTPKINRPLFVLMLLLASSFSAIGQECSCAQPGCDTGQLISSDDALLDSGLIAESKDSVCFGTDWGAEIQDEPLFSLVSHHQSCSLHNGNCQRCACSRSCCHCRESGCSFRLTEFNNYTTFSYLDDKSGTFNELEFTSQSTFGNIKMENHTILNVADLPSTISLGPTNPGEASPPLGVRANGFGDVLTAFFFSRRNVERNFELGIGPVITLPSATDDILGARQWTIGPGAHFSTDVGRLTAGFFVWQSWKVGGSSASTRTNQLFGKPFFLYELNEKWQLIYVPLGLSHSWEKKSGEDWTVPLGGGLRRRFQIRDQKMGLQAQVFDYVAQKKGDPDWEFRMTVEFLFD